MRALQNLSVITDQTLQEESLSHRGLLRFLNAVLIDDHPVQALRQLKEDGTLTSIVPRFAETWGPQGEQDRRFHPEGNVWEHTLLVLDDAKKYEAPEMRLAALFHDIGKPSTFRRWPTTGGISNHGHNHKGRLLFTEEIAPALGMTPELNRSVGVTIEYHMLMHRAHDEQAVSGDLLSFISALPEFPYLLALNQIDLMATSHDLSIRLATDNTGRIAERLRALGLSANYEFPALRRPR